MKRPTTIQADGAAMWSNSNGVLTGAADNVLCSRLASAAHAAINASAGDSIDLGLALLAEMGRQGFGVIYLGEPERSDGVQAAGPQQLVCSRCEADRFKQPCGDPHSGQCPMVGAAHGMKASRG